MKKTIFSFTGILFAACLFAQEAKNEDYVIGAEDVLAVNVWREAELSVREMAVRPDGKVSMNLIGDIQASGLTPKQLQEQIAGKLKEYVETPHVTVTVIKALSHSVSLVGNVSKPGNYPIGSPTTVLSMIARAGGLTEYAKAKNIKIFRNENGKIKQFPFNYKDAINGKDLQKNILLQSGDTVSVP